MTEWTELIVIEVNTRGHLRARANQAMQGQEGASARAAVADELQRMIVSMRDPAAEDGDPSPTLQ